MKSLFLLALLIAGGAFAQDDGAVDRARQILELLRNEKSDEVAAQFNAQVAAALSPARLAQVWTTLRGQAGEFQSVIDTQSAPVQNVIAVTLGLQFERGALNMIVAFDSDNKIAGLRFVPRPVEKAQDATPAPVREEAVTIGTGDWALPGTLSIPSGAGPFPAVVLVHGSGPHDRDETVGPNKPFRDLAWGLAQAGVAVLRYEKRTRQHAEQFARLRNFTTREEVIDDAVLAVDLLRSHDRIDSRYIVVLGHSLGGALAPRIAEANPHIAGLIVLAGNSRPLPELLIDQLVYLGSLETGLADPKLALESVKREAQRVMDPGLPLDTPTSELLLQLPASYWRDLNAYKPAETAARLKLPMLILQGERDYQVTMDDLAGWRNALGGREGITIKTYPDLNHLFITGEGKSTPREYGRPGHVSEEVIRDIALWVQSLTRQ